ALGARRTMRERPVRSPARWRNTGSSLLQSIGGGVGGGGSCVREIDCATATKNRGATRSTRHAVLRIRERLSNGRALELFRRRLPETAYIAGIYGPGRPRATCELCPHIMHISVAACRRRQQLDRFQTLGSVTSRSE